MQYDSRKWRYVIGGIKNHYCGGTQPNDIENRKCHLYYAPNWDEIQGNNGNAQWPVWWGDDTFQICTGRLVRQNISRDPAHMPISAKLPMIGGMRT